MHYSQLLSITHEIHQSRDTYNDTKVFQNIKAFDRVLYNRVILKRSCETRLYYHNTICHVKDILSHGNNSWDIVEARIPVGSIFAKAVTGDVLLKTCS